jgi:N6-adenosine-specific RNA methylase IME4
LGHSVKPDEIMRRIEKLFGPNTTKIELFARRAVDGWDRWGDEA